MRWLWSRRRLIREVERLVAELDTARRSRDQQAEKRRLQRQRADVLLEKMLGERARRIRAEQKLAQLQRESPAARGDENSVIARAVALGPDDGFAQTNEA